MSKPVIVIGAGGHALACLDLIRPEMGLDIQGLLDDTHKIGEIVHGYPVLGPVSSIASVHPEVEYVFGIGKVGRNPERLSVLHELRRLRRKLVTLVSESANVSSSAALSAGAVIFPGTVIGAKVSIDIGAVINSGAVVEHQSSIGVGSHISTQAAVNGSCRIGDDCLVGSGAVVFPGVHVPDGFLLPAGEVLRRSPGSEVQPQ